MHSAIPNTILDAVKLAHPSWHASLTAGLEAMLRNDPNYLAALAKDEYLPTQGRLFAAFRQPLNAVRYVLVGEGPYPRPASATGFCFMDGAVDELWSPTGLSKPVNRATSLRNFMKMLLVADGQLSPDHTTGDTMASVASKAQAANSSMIQTLADLQENLTQHGFLLLNATLVYRPHVPPTQEARAWHPFLEVVLKTMLEYAKQTHALPILILWGKIAAHLRTIPSTTYFPQATSEHPYNLSFINNTDMQALFGAMNLLQKSPLLFT